VLRALLAFANMHKPVLCIEPAGRAEEGRGHVRLPSNALLASRNMHKATHARADGTRKGGKEGGVCEKQASMRFSTRFLRVREVALLHKATHARADGTRKGGKEGGVCEKQASMRFSIRFLRVRDIY
jgi:hypothetical protein